jgi:hypothetical protein
VFTPNSGLWSLIFMTKHFRKTVACIEGLTERESSEFKLLSETAPGTDDFEARVRDARWIELYLKQETAKILAGDFTTQKKR